MRAQRRVVCVTSLHIRCALEYAKEGSELGGMGVGHRCGRLITFALGAADPTGGKARREDAPVGLGPAPLHTPLRGRGSAAERLGRRR